LILIGGFVQLLAGFLAFRKYDHLGGAAFLTFSALWGSYGATKVLCAAPVSGRLLDIGAGNTEGFTAGSVAFLVLNAFLILLASSFNVVLLCLTLAMELLAICFLLFTLDNLPLPFETVVLSILSLICFYGATASLANCMFGKNLLMMGPALLTVQSPGKEGGAALPCVCPRSHLTSGLRTIAELLKAGAVCGVPTDTVYALAASCRHPQAIEKVYRIKDRPQEKPICIFISNLEQLRAAAPPISPLLWEFMENVYPGGIGCIIQKGEWLRKLGVGAGYSRVGTQDSIMIRVPDLTVLVHLIDMTGPLAITSANPSGEVDSTHHDMVISRLGHQLEGVLCDGDSDEVVASTVVNCTKIDESGITIVREGCIPAGKVMQIFERVKNR
ncbi:YRDC protein, partial [Sitta europaea]|nr:YRDC protein [Sitta europaea]